MTWKKYTELVIPTVLISNDKYKPTAGDIVQDNNDALYIVMRDVDGDLFLLSEGENSQLMPFNYVVGTLQKVGTYTSLTVS